MTLISSNSSVVHIEQAVVLKTLLLSEKSLLALLRRETTLVASADAVLPKVFAATFAFASPAPDALALCLLGGCLLLVVILRMDGKSRVVHCCNKAALAVNVVFHCSGGAVGLFETVLALGLVTVSSLKVFLDIVSVVVMDSVAVLVLWILQSKICLFKNFGTSTFFLLIF
jgi:hypothetical protein